MQGLVPLIGIAVVLTVAGRLIRTISATSLKGRLDFPYQKEPALFTAAERSFLGVLEQAVEGRFRVFGKVRVADVITVKTGLTRSA